MKIFISWSGARSHALAAALRKWLPLVVHYVEPWLSEADISAGERWSHVIAQELESSSFGIVCATPESATSDWVLFETGALAKSIDSARVVPLLVGLDFADISGPLAQFQAKKANRQVMLDLIRSINRQYVEPIYEDRIDQLFHALWPQVERSLSASLQVA